MDSPSNKTQTVALVCTALNILGGLSRHILQLYLHLNRKKFRVIIVYYSKQRDIVEAFFIQGGVKAEDLIFVPLSSGGMFIPGLMRLASVFRQQGVALVHTFLLHSDILGFLASRMAEVKVFISSVEGKLLPDEVNGVSGFKKSVYRVLNRMLRRYFDLTVTVSQDLKEEVLGASPGVRDIAIIPVGVAPNVPYEQLPSRTPKAAYVIGCLSQLNKDKGVENLIRVVPAVRQKMPNVRFLIAGTGEEEQPLKALANRLNVEEHLVFCGWVKDIHNFLLGVDVFVIPSLREGCPAALLEAMSLARPAVGFDVPGVKEIIRHGQTGLLVEPFDLDRLANEIVVLCRDEEYSRSLGRRAKEVVEERYSIRREIEKFETEYSRLLAR